MPKQLTYIFFVVVIFQMEAQEKRIPIVGKVTNDSTSVEGISILNKTTGKGTITNGYGHFIIPVKENDTLIISGIQFYYNEVRIDKKVINNKTLLINLLQKINELEEVTVKSNTLLGTLSNDAGNVKEQKSKIAPNVLDFSMIDFNKPVTAKMDEFDRRKPPDAIALVDPAFMGGGAISAGVSFKLYESKEKKKLKKLEKIDNFNNEIKSLISEGFFIDKLGIRRELIDDYIEYCKTKGLLDLYVKNKKIEMIDLLFKEVNNYKNKN